MNSLEELFHRKYIEFDLSDETFEYPRTDWRNYVPYDIKQNWRFLSNDERFLVALTSELASNLD
jgi:hypothetical protein